MRSSKISSSASSKTLKTSKLCSTIQRPGAVSGSALVKIWALSRCSTHGWYTIDAPQRQWCTVMLETMLLWYTFVFYDAPRWYTMMIHFHTQIHYDSVLQCSTMFHTTLVHYDARTWSHKQSFLSPRRDAPVAHHRHMVLWSWKHFQTHQSVLVHWIMSRNYLQVLHVCTNQHNHGHTL